MSTILLLSIVSLLYPWIGHSDASNALVSRIIMPDGFERISAADGSFGDWLRYLPLKPGNPPVMLFNGLEKTYQNGHHAVVEIDIGDKDLQQCADAIIRLYAEFSYSKRDFASIAFVLTNGDTAYFSRWVSGYRPSVSRNVVTWQKKALPDSSYATFRDYCDFVFTYAGTYSLERQLKDSGTIENLAIGDIFIQGGFPGHAVLVTDMAVHKMTGEKIFLLCQSFMPAQDIHILRNLNDPELSPWYTLNFSDTLHTPKWTFLADDLRRF